MQTMQGTSSLTARQIKAARALLDWSQDDLAAASELSVATIRKLELGFISPRHSTTHDIRKCFEDAGLEFIEPGGVRYRPEDIKVYQSVEGTKEFFDDVYETAVTNGGDVIVVCPSERPFNEVYAYEHGEMHFKRMTAIMDRTSVKCILTEDKSDLPAIHYCEYRWISKQYVDSVPFYVYGNKYAIIVSSADPSPKITVIQSRVVANAFRQQFYSMWEKATPLNNHERLDDLSAKKISGR